MWPVSAEFASKVRSSHRAVTVVEVWDTTSRLATLLPVGGAVTVDRSRTVRRDLTAELADPDGAWTPADATGLLAPYGNELKVWRGIVLDDGSSELVPLGVFRTTGMKVTSGDSGVVVSLTAADRSRQVARNRFIDEYQIAGGTDVAQVVTALLLDRYPACVYDLPDTGHNCGKAVLEAGESSDPWRDAQAIAESAGLRLAFDPTGVARLYAPADPDGTPDATYTDTADCVLLSVGREMDDDGLYSGVIATGESSELTAPVRGEAWDDNPSSPTYRYGKFGEVPRFYSSPFLVTANQCVSAATLLLADGAGGTESIEWTQIVNPAHDADDLIDITEAGSKASARIVLDSLTVPLTADQPMTGTGRTWRTA